MDSMKAIQITIDERLLAALDRTLKGSRRRRSAFVRQSIANELRRIGRRRLEEADRRGYLELPIEPDEFYVDPIELVWGDEWQPHNRRSKRA
jgi:metal-responsive CopG/Arc/MetJ family transcriptional regulator